MFIRYQENTSAAWELFTGDCRVHIEKFERCSITVFVLGQNCLLWINKFTLSRTEGLDLRTPHWDTRGSTLQLFVRMFIRYHESRSVAWELFTVVWWVHIVKCKRCSITVFVLGHDGQCYASRCSHVHSRP